jgi:hypothetical protein
MLLVMTDGLADRLPMPELLALVAGALNANLGPQLLGELRRRVFERVAGVAGEPDDATLLAVRVGTAALGGHC